MAHIPLTWCERAANKMKMYFLSRPTLASRARLNWKKEMREPAPQTDSPV